MMLYSRNSSFFCFVLELTASRASCTWTPSISPAWSLKMAKLGTQGSMLDRCPESLSAISDLDVLITTMTCWALRASLQYTGTGAWASAAGACAGVGVAVAVVMSLDATSTTSPEVTLGAAWFAAVLPFPLPLPLPLPLSLALALSLSFHLPPSSSWPAGPVSLGPGKTVCFSAWSGFLVLSSHLWSSSSFGRSSCGAGVATGALIGFAEDDSRTGAGAMGSWSLASSAGCWMMGREGRPSWLGRPNVQRNPRSEKVTTTTMMREGVKSERIVAGQVRSDQVRSGQIRSGRNRWAYLGGGCSNRTPGCFLHRRNSVVVAIMAL
ncbi:hypothetical protein B5807_09977 [Epicoccum nigrum]|uniref:Secreted protein n=1 Tax=Epicoccum nigrum TaxID=105696 RepID=A0A1Y2LTG5_EPING|nr:hypothetical protein B5807_09977 [Epicoccum nigrum]